MARRGEEAAEGGGGGAAGRGRRGGKRGRRDGDEMTPPRHCAFGHKQAVLKEAEPASERT